MSFALAPDCLRTKISTRISSPNCVGTRLATHRESRLASKVVSHKVIAGITKRGSLPVETRVSFKGDRWQGGRNRLLFMRRGRVLVRLSGLRRQPLFFPREAEPSAGWVRSSRPIPSPGLVRCPCRLPPVLGAMRRGISRTLAFWRS